MLHRDSLLRQYRNTRTPTRLLLIVDTTVQHQNMAGFIRKRRDIASVPPADIPAVFVRQDSWHTAATDDRRASTLETDARVAVADVDLHRFLLVKLSKGNVNAVGDGRSALVG